MARTKWTLELINEKLKDRGIECLEYGGGRKLVSSWEHTCGNRWEAIAHNILKEKQPAGCPSCGLTKQGLSGRVWTKELINAKILVRGLTCVSYAGTIRSKDSKWACRCGNNWTSDAGNILGGKGCRVCAGLARVTKDVVDKRLEEDGRGITCTVYGGTADSKSTFQCRGDASHVWVSTVESVTGLKKYSCPWCVHKGPASLTLDEVNERISYLGIVCITYAGNTRHKSTFLCGAGHTWATTANSLLSMGTGCKICSPGGFNPSLPGYLYYFELHSPATNLYKIGITNHTPEHRARSFGASCSYHLLDSILLTPGALAYEIEQHLLASHHQHRAAELAFSILESGWTETFTRDILQGKKLATVVNDYLSIFS